MRMILSSDSSIPHSRLGEFSPGERGEIVGFCADVEFQDFLQRLCEVGFLVGEKVEVLREAPFSHDPISIRIKEATYALRRQDANLIFVNKIQDSV